ncbi:MAG TPA: hypothetical protein VMG12_30265 [Polyangiaceae bacterium]|nr:hypothetical protein [Polyangiaceae bacterium]
MLALFAPPLAAAPAPIEWEAPEGCPGPDVVLAELRRALDTEVVELGAVLRVRGVVIAEAAVPRGAAAATPRFRLTLEVVDERRRSTRSFAAERCDDLARTAALAISLAVHESSEGGDSTGRATLVGQPHDTAASPIDAHTDMVAAPALQREDADRPVWWSAGADAVLDLGSLPEAALGIGLAARAGLDPLELHLHALLLPSQRRALGNGDAAEFGLLAAGLRACLHLLDRPLVVAGCLGVEAGRYTATGVGLQPGREVHDPWLAAGPALLARTRFEGPLQLELLVEPLLPLARKQYAVDGTDIVHSPAVVNSRFQLGLVIGGPRHGGGL